MTFSIYECLESYSLKMKRVIMKQSIEQNAKVIYQNANKFGGVASRFEFCVKHLSTILPLISIVVATSLSKMPLRNNALIIFTMWWIPGLGISVVVSYFGQRSSCTVEGPHESFRQWFLEFLTIGFCATPLYIHIRGLASLLNPRTKLLIIMNLSNHLLYPHEDYPGENILQMLESSLNPNQTIRQRCLKDLILVSIDVGLDPNGCLDTIGVARLDSHSLAGSPKKDPIMTKLLLLRRHWLPLNQKTRQYLFGIPVYSPPKAAYEILQTIFRQVDQERGGLRNIFLVGHNIKSDLRFLKDTIGFSIESTPSIITIIDTQQLARRVFNFRHKYISLKLTMSTLGLQARQLHNSGNDAVYTLKALIYLFCNYQIETIEQSKLFIGPQYHERNELTKLPIIE